MCFIAEFIRSAYHWMAKVIDYEEQATIFSLWDDNAVIVTQQAFLKDQMSAP